MATVQPRTKVAAGSAEWIGTESLSTMDFVQQETEEFAFSVRNEMEWLNEHMAEVFNRSHFDVIEAFKTPGKLRGKTPRTGRRINALEDRAPLTDIFTSKAERTPSLLREAKSSKQATRFQVAEDQDNDHMDNQPILRFSAGLGKENTDSGYHGMTDDDNDDGPGFNEIVCNLTSEEFKSLQQPAKGFEQPASITRPQEKLSEIPSVQDDKEDDQGDPGPVPVPDLGNDDDPELVGQETDLHISPQGAIVPSGQTARTSHQYSISADTVAALYDALDEVERTSPQRPRAQHQPDSSPSDTSCLARPVVRKKSSLTFASLPAREPLTSMKNMAPRMSRVSHVEQPKLGAGLSESYLEKFVGSKVQAEAPRQLTAPDLVNDEGDEPTQIMKEGVDTVLEAEKAQREMKAQSKASTQRLQERLAMLGKSNPPRLSRSVPTNTITISQTTVHESATLAQNSPSHKIAAVDDAEDWIGPISESQHPAASLPTAITTHQAIAQAEADNGRLEEISHGTTAKNITGVPVVTCSTMAGSSAPSKQSPVRTVLGSSYPNLSTQVSTTPIGSPVQRRHLDGPLSASKAKLYSVLKSAKGMFASTAHATTQARPETKIPEFSPSRVIASSIISKNPSVGTTNILQNLKPSINQADVIPLSLEEANHDQPRTIRRSSQRLEEAKKQVEAKRSGEKEQLNQEVAKLIDVQSQEPFPSKTAVPDVSSLEDFLKKRSTVLQDHPGPTDLLPPPPPKTQLPVSQLQRPGDLRRPPRPTKDAPKARPAPVSIKLASQRIGQIAPSNASLGLALHESLAQPPLTRPTLFKKASSSSFHTTSSAQSFKTSVSSTSTRPRALEAAARKKEQDEKEAHRKLEQKRELERKRAAKAEEERRVVEGLRVAEQQRQAEARNAAQRQAAEQRKADAIRRNDQARKEAAAARNHAAEDTIDGSHVERLQQIHSKDDITSNKTTLRNTNTQGSIASTVPHINPAKPAKRQHEFDEEPSNDFAEQGQRNGSSDAIGPKRRRTSEEFPVEVPQRPTMAPPIRPSNMHKKLSNKFTQGFLNNATTAHTAPSMLKAAITTQHNLQHPKTPHMNDLAKFSNAKITFAEQQHPAHLSSQAQPLQLHQRTLSTAKTPGTVTKSSPQYPNGDFIDLPEITTDSEDSGDENDFVPPGWTDSPELREALRRQQLVDPMQVFGPIAPLMMEDVFKGNKERQARFRARTSSANWNGPDRLTEDERRKDREARERLEREGAWTYGGSI